MIFTTIRLERPESTVLLRGIPVQIELADPQDAERVESTGARPFDRFWIYTSLGVPSVPLRRRDVLYDELNTDPETGQLAKYRVSGLVETLDNDHQEALCERLIGGERVPMPTRPPGVALPAQPNTFAALQAMQSIVLAECLVGGTTPFAALNASDAARYGVASAVFIGQPKDFADAYLPQCRIWIASESETIALAAYAGRAEAELEAIVRVYVDLRPDWYLAEQKVLSIRDALWPALLRHERLGGTVATVIESQARHGRGLCYEQVAGSDYRCYEARWLVRQQWSIAGGRVL